MFYLLILVVGGWASLAGGLAFFDSLPAAAALFLFLAFVCAVCLGVFAEHAVARLWQESSLSQVVKRRRRSPRTSKPVAVTSPVPSSAWSAGPPAVSDMWAAPAERRQPQPYEDQPVPAPAPAVAPSPWGEIPPAPPAPVEATPAAGISPTPMRQPETPWGEASAPAVQPDSPWAGQQ